MVEQSSTDNNNKVSTYEEQIAESIKKQLAATQNQSNRDDVVSTGGQTYSIFNEKKESRFLSMMDYYGDDGENEGQQDDQSEGYNIMSRRSSILDRQRRGSFHSLLVVDTLKFLNDDTDVVPTKRGEPLFFEQQFKTSPPSEVFKALNGGQQSTPVPSLFGGYMDDEYHWNSTIMSNQEYQMYQQTVCGT